MTKKKLETNEYRWSTKDAYSRVTEKKWSGGTFLTGEIATKHGFVMACTQGDFNMPLTKLEFVWNGFCYVKQWNRNYSKRYITTLAKRFADEIVCR